MSDKPFVPDLSDEAVCKAVAGAADLVWYWETYRARTIESILELEALLAREHRDLAWIEKMIAVAKRLTQEAQSA